jgi:hypothetical protein
VAFRQMLVQGIQQHGAIQLKNYLRSRTTQKKVMAISFKTWYYAAAAVALLLVSSTAVLWLSQKNEKAQEIASQNTEKKLPESKNEQSITGETEQPTDQTTTPESEPAITDDIAANGGSGAAEPQTGTEDLAPAASPTFDYPDVVIIASNIPVKPIRIESNFDETIAMRKAESRGRIVNPKTPTAADKDGVAEKKSSIDTQRIWTADQMANSEADEEDIERFKLSFANTRDALPQIQLTKDKTTNNNELMVYNLPYDNPLILNYDSRYFLKAGDKYYEINMNQTKKQTVTPVTDPTVLAALNK